MQATLLCSGLLYRSPTFSCLFVLILVAVFGTFPPLAVHAASFTCDTKPHDNPIDIALSAADDTLSIKECQFKDTVQFSCDESLPVLNAKTFSIQESVFAKDFTIRGCKFDSPHSGILFENNIFKQEVHVEKTTFNSGAALIMRNQVLSGEERGGLWLLANEWSDSGRLELDNVRIMNTTRSVESSMRLKTCTFRSNSSFSLRNSILGNPLRDVGNDYALYFLTTTFNSSIFELHNSAFHSPRTDQMAISMSKTGGVSRFIWNSTIVVDGITATGVGLIVHREEEVSRASHVEFVNTNVEKKVEIVALTAEGSSSSNNGVGRIANAIVKDCNIGSITISGTILTRLRVLRCVLRDQAYPTDIEHIPKPTILSSSFPTTDAVSDVLIQDTYFGHMLRVSNNYFSPSSRLILLRVSFNSLYMDNSIFNNSIMVLQNVELRGDKYANNAVLAKYCEFDGSDAIFMVRGVVNSVIPPPATTISGLSIYATKIQHGARFAVIDSIFFYSVLFTAPGIVQDGGLVLMVNVTSFNMIEVHVGNDGYAALIDTFGLVSTKLKSATLGKFSSHGILRYTRPIPTFENATDAQQKKHKAIVEYIANGLDRDSVLFGRLRSLEATIIVKDGGGSDDESVLTAIEGDAAGAVNDMLSEKVGSDAAAVSVLPVVDLQSTNLGAVELLGAGKHPDGGPIRVVMTNSTLIGTFKASSCVFTTSASRLQFHQSSFAGIHFYQAVTSFGAQLSISRTTFGASGGVDAAALFEYSPILYGASHCYHACNFTVPSQRQHLTYRSGSFLLHGSTLSLTNSTFAGTRDIIDYRIGAHIANRSAIIVKDSTCLSPKATFKLDAFPSSRLVLFERVTGCLFASVTKPLSSGADIVDDPFISVQFVDVPMGSHLEVRYLDFDGPTQHLLLRNVQLAKQATVYLCTFTNGATLLADDLTIGYQPAIVPENQVLGLVVELSLFKQSGLMILNNVNISSFYYVARMVNTHFVWNSSFVLKGRTYLEATKTTTPALQLNRASIDNTSQLLLLDKTSIVGKLEFIAAGTFGWLYGLMVVEPTCTLSSLNLNMVSEAVLIWDAPTLHPTRTVTIVVNGLLGNSLFAKTNEPPPVPGAERRGIYMRFYDADLPSTLTDFKLSGEIRQLDFINTVTLGTAPLEVNNARLVGSIKFLNSTTKAVHFNDQSMDYMPGSTILFENSTIGGQLKVSGFLANTTLAVRGTRFTNNRIYMPETKIKDGSNICIYNSVFEGHEAFFGETVTFQNSADCAIVNNTYRVTSAGALRLKGPLTTQDDDLTLLVANNNVFTTKYLTSETLPKLCRATLIGNNVADATSEDEVHVFHIASKNRPLTSPPVVRYAMCNTWGTPPQPFTANRFEAVADFKQMPCEATSPLYACTGDMELPFPVGTADDDPFIACRPATSCNNFYHQGLFTILVEDARAEGPTWHQQVLLGDQVASNWSWVHEVDVDVVDYTINCGPDEVVEHPRQPTATTSHSLSATSLPSLSLLKTPTATAENTTSSSVKWRPPLASSSTATPSETLSTTREPTASISETEVPSTTTAAPSTTPEPTSAPPNITTPPPTTSEPSTPAPTSVVSSEATEVLLDVVLGDEDVATAVTITTSVGAAGAGLATPAAGGAIVRMTGAIESINCLYSEDQFVEPPSGWLPVKGFDVDSGDLFGKMAGYLLVNVAVLIAAPQLFHFAVLGTIFPSATILNNDLVGFVVKVSAATLALLHAYFIPTFFGVVTVIFLHSSSTTCLAIAVGAAVALLGLVLFPMRHFRSATLFASVCIEIKPTTLVQESDEQTTSSESTTTSSITSSSEHEDMPEMEDGDRSREKHSNKTNRKKTEEIRSLTAFENANEDFPYVEMYSSFFDPYKNVDVDPKARTFFLWEQGISSLISILSNIRPKDGNCVLVAVPIVFVAIVHLAYLSFVRPYDSKLEFGMVYCHAVINVFMGIMAVAIITSNGFLGEDSAAVKTLGILAIVEGMTFLVQTVVMMIWSWIREKIRRSIRLKHQEAMRRDREEEMDALARSNSSRSKNGTEELDDVAVVVTSSGGRGGPARVKAHKSAYSTTAAAVLDVPLLSQQETNTVGHDVSHHHLQYHNNPLQ